MSGQPTILLEKVRGMPHDEWCATRLDESPTCDCIRVTLLRLADVAEAAHQLVGVSTHVNVTGPEYQDRKLMYHQLRRSLEGIQP